MLKRFATLLTLLTALFLFNACDDAPQITKPIIDEILTDPIPVTQSRYTGGLQRVGTVKGFGDSGAHTPIAIEWNGQHLYMIAGGLHNQYLYTVDRETGIAKIVNRNAKNLGGSFIIYEIEFKDMTWNPNTNQMLGVDHRGDGSILYINLQNGYAEGPISKKAFGLYHPKDDTEHGREFGGYPIIGSPIAIAYTEGNFYMWGISGRSVELNKRGFKSFGALYEIPNLSTATPVGDPKFYGEGEAHATSLCHDGQFLYMSGLDTGALYILDQQTAKLYFIAEWHFTQMPEGFKLNKFGRIHDIERKVNGNIWIQGITFDGTDMFAVESFTNGLYKLEKR